MKYINESEVADSITYFERFETNHNDAVGAFFVLKGAGFTNFNKHFYDDWKNQVPDKIWLMGSIYDVNEIGSTCCFLFPFSISDNIKKSHFFNAATPLRNIASRFRDTTDNALTDYYVEKFGNRKDNTEFYKLKNSYLQDVKNLLEGKKIELKHLLCWIYKFNEIEAQGDELTDEEAFLLLRNKFLIDFKISQSELDEFFVQSIRFIRLSDESITGQKVRDLLSFNSDVNIGFTRNLNSHDFKPITFIDNVSINKIIMIMYENPSKDYFLYSLKLKGQIILYGPPGTSKTHTAKNIIGPEYNMIFEIQFHPNTSYQEFIGGKQVKTDGKFEDKNGILIEAIIYAQEKKQEQVLLIIDEINRGNITSILGEAILALDRGYTTSLVSYDCKDTEGKISIPSNLHIVGTMNSSDRSISIEDKAILRRFNKIRVYPDYDLLKSVTDFTGLKGFDITDFLKKLNQKVFDELNDIDMQVGHAYLLPNFISNKNGKFVWTPDAFLHVFNDAIMPLLEEFTVGSQENLNKILGVDYSQRVYDFDKLMETVLTKI